MKIKPEQIKALIANLDSIIDRLDEAEKDAINALKSVDAIYKKSARNLIHYKAFRQVDLRGVQKKLQNIGLTRLSNSEKHIYASLIQTRFILYRLLSHNVSDHVKSGLSIKNGRRLLAKHTSKLLGEGSKDRRVRIMVTQPTQSALDYGLVHSMVKNGMDCARINCAHDNPKIWEAIIYNVKKASKALNKSVKITMDLAGPKIRTRFMMTHVEDKKFSAAKVKKSKTRIPVSIHLVSEMDENSPSNTVKVSKDFLASLDISSILHIKDSKRKNRTLSVSQVFKNSVEINCNDTLHLSIGSVLTCINGSIGSTQILDIALQPIDVIVEPDDCLIMSKRKKIEETSPYKTIDLNSSTKYIGCDIPEVYEKTKIGDPISFDDGKIEGIIEEVAKNELVVRVLKAKQDGSRLKAEKGINLPRTDLGISGLTTKDKADLKFIVGHADVVNFSFVNSKADVKELLAELKKLNAIEAVDIVIKIETRKAFDNLTEILLAAMMTKHIGVMIARGDLAIETGWDNIGRIQQDILNLCSAAHIPVIWATQVFENFAKKGIPSRAEITDAVNALKAECVMLNKGPYIKDVLELLDKILCQMELYYEKNEPMLPKMLKA